MEKNTYQKTLHSLPKLLKPIIRILLRSGIDFKQFVHYSRKLFVEVASEDYGIKGRKTNISRVSVLTGIGRSHVSKIRKELKSSNAFIENDEVSRASKILRAWHEDSLFIDKSCKPKNLPIESSTETSFTDLITKYKGDIPETVLFKELISSQSVEVIDKKIVKVVSRTFIPKEKDVKNIFTTDIAVTDLTNILHHHFLLNQVAKDNDYENTLEFSDAGQVLTQWHTDKMFQDSDSTPLPLALNGSLPSFASLVNKAIPGADYKEILNKLLIAESVKLTRNAYVHPIKRIILLPNTHIAYMSRLSSVITDLISTLQYNLLSDGSAPSRFEGRAYNRFIPLDAQFEFNSFLKLNAENFLKMIDEWLIDLEKRYADKLCEPYKKITLGAGIYMIQRLNHIE